MSLLNIGDRVRCEDRGVCGTVLSVEEDGSCGVSWDADWEAESQECLTLLPSPVSLLDEVQVLINILVSTGNDQPRVLSRKVAQLMANTRGALSRSDKLQCAAMLLVSAGLRELADPERDDG